MPLESHRTRGIGVNDRLSQRKTEGGRWWRWRESNDRQSPYFDVAPGGGGGKSRNMDRVTFSTFFETFSGFGLIPRASVATPRQMSLLEAGSTRSTTSVPVV